MSFFCQDEAGFSPGDYCGYLSIDCHGDGDSTWNPVSGMTVDFMMRCCTPSESTSSCDATDDCKKDSDGDGIADSDDPDDDNDGIPDTEDDDDDGDGIPDDDDIDRDSDGDGIPDKYDTDDDNDGIPDTEDDDDDGDGIPDDEEGDYKDFDEPPYSSSSLSEAAGRFGTRFHLFISTMKNTSLFSLPSNFVGNIPSSGNSVLVIDGGETYGQQVIDFSHWSAGWLVFRSVILISSSFIALRILTLKH
ncbi:MAG: hypothetical protein D3914_10120 [Candidatus Electrothrix sp. LOE2]|nr:hypothetical protein [Candidatus Electrothrix sp. LOE2]